LCVVLISSHFDCTAVLCCVSIRTYSEGFLSVPTNREVPALIRFI